MCNFDQTNFENLEEKLQEFVTANLNKGRWKRSSILGTNELLLFATTLRYGGPLDVLACVFAVKSETFELRLVSYIFVD